MMILKEFSRIVCVSLFSYQGSLFVCLSDSSFTLSHSPAPVKYFFQVFSRYFDVCVSLLGDLFTLSHVRFFVNNYFCFFQNFSNCLIRRNNSLRQLSQNTTIKRICQHFFELFLFFQFRTLCVLQPPNTATVTFSSKIAINTFALIRAFSSYVPPLTQSLNSYHFPILSRRNSIAFFKLTIKI